MSAISIYWKRIISSLIDISISILPGFVIYSNTSGKGLRIIYLVAVIIFSIYTVITSTILKSGTLGDYFMKIKIINIDGSEVSLKKLLFRNITYCLWLGWLFFLSINTRVVDNIIFLLITIMLYLIMFSNKNKFNENLSALDMIFKTKYISILDS